MTIGGPEKPGGGRPGRGVDTAVWVLVIAALIGLAGAVAWSLSNVTFKIREVSWPDDRPELVEGPIEVATVQGSPDPERPPPARPVETRGPAAGAGVRPVWTRRPAPVYPALAQSRGIDRGDVQLRCEALASGELGACEILHESPSGVGFAEAALASTRQARVRPYSIDGFETDSRVAFTVRFQMAPEP